MTTRPNIYRMHVPREQHEDPLNLRSLPLAEPPDDCWPEIEAALRAQNRNRKRVRYAGLALAATVVLALATGIYLNPAQVPTGDSAAGLAGAPEAQAEKTPIPEDSPPDETLTSLIGLSQQLENRVRRYRAEVGGLPSSDLVYQVELEDLIAQVDGELSMNPESVGLWNQRVMLMADLSRLYQNRLRRDYHQMASL